MFLGWSGCWNGYEPSYRMPATERDLTCIANFGRRAFLNYRTEQAALGTVIAYPQRGYCNARACPPTGWCDADSCEPPEQQIITLVAQPTSGAFVRWECSDGRTWDWAVYQRTTSGTVDCKAVFK
jgi:DNA primase